MKMEQFISTNRKAQAWGIDLIVAIIIFIAILIILSAYVSNSTKNSSYQIQELFEEGRTASDILLGDFYPGVISGKKINQTKIEELNTTDYDQIKKDLSLKNDFYLTFEGLNYQGEPMTHIGRINSSSSNSLIKITRISSYENKPIKFEIYIWK